MRPTRSSLVIGVVIAITWIAVMFLSTDRQKSGELTRFLAMVLGPSGMIGSLCGRPLLGMALGFGVVVAFIVVGVMIYGVPC
jgi:hypothetical protein